VGPLRLLHRQHPPAVMLTEHEIVNVPIFPACTRFLEQHRPRKFVRSTRAFTPVGLSPTIAIDVCHELLLPACTASTSCRRLFPTGGYRTSLKRARGAGGGGRGQRFATFLEWIDTNCFTTVLAMSRSAVLLSLDGFRAERALGGSGRARRTRCRPSGRLDVSRCQPERLGTRLLRNLGAPGVRTLN